MGDRWGPPTVHTIAGPRGIRIEPDLTDGTYVLRGRAAGRLPAGAKGDEATVEYRDGVLTVSVPVPETKTGTRTIPVHHV